MTLVNDLRLDVGDDDGVFASGAAASFHNLLSSIHTDTVAANPSQGAVIVGSGSSWVALPSGAEGEYLGIIGGGAAWANPIATINAGGDISGVITNVAVTGIRGIEVAGTAPTVGQVLKYNGSQWEAADDETASGSGIFGPGSSTDNAVVRFNGTAGNAVQDSQVIIDDFGNVTMPSGMIVGGRVLASGALWVEVSLENYITVVSNSGVLVCMNASPVTWEQHIIKDGVGLADISSITIHGSGNTIDGDASIELSNRYGAVTVVWNGTEWNIV